MLSIDLTTHQLNQVIKDFKKYRDIVDFQSGKGLRGFYIKVSRVLMFIFKRQFEEEGTYLSPTKWPSLKASTLIEKRGSGFNIGSGSILRRTDRYYKALTDPKSRDRKIEITNDALKFGVIPENFRDEFGLVYPELHEQGTNTMAARPIFAALRQKKGKDVLTRTLRHNLIKYLEQELKKVG